MKIFYDNTTRTVTIENLNKYFASGSLVATASDDNVSINYTNNDKLEIFDHFSAFQKENGTQAGANVTDTVTYLNQQFNRGVIMGVSSFAGLGNTKTVSDNRIESGDTILIQAVGALNEVLGVTVANGSFTVTRTIIATLAGLTNNLGFMWVRM